ncbi:hypothetical protein [Bacillus chungangensis]|uniref:Uncharacterized protein n=1 Tax=Bacillus chungangensis TaxID=587633 RepID=A0ABT9WMF9_9BACI|nr:hypothetical protein [Bacillus chungangensis]MDQ0174472.1 hypothetical protein [Bacillus chungangensis]
MYAQLVKPINQLLMDINASISVETGNQIIENLESFYNGDKQIADCHLDESKNFMKDGIQLLKQGHLSNGALQMFGSELNFASYAAKVAANKNADKHEQLADAFKLISNSFK